MSYPPGTDTVDIDRTLDAEACAHCCHRCGAVVFAHAAGAAVWDDRAGCWRHCDEFEHAHGVELLCAACEESE